MSDMPAPDATHLRPGQPSLMVEEALALVPRDLNDLCDATDAGIHAGGGFGWVDLPARAILKRYWFGVLANPDRHLIVGRVDDVIAGTVQLTFPPASNQAQAHIATLASGFVAPWARGYGLARMITQFAIQRGRDRGAMVLNLDVRETQTQAIRLYEGLGFERYGRHPRYARIRGNDVAGLFYYLDLTTQPGSSA